MRLKITICTITVLFGLFTACEEPQLQEPLPEKNYDLTGFVKGADISWLTEMEKAGVNFYNANGQKTECMRLLRELGMNTIRLRVWVNPVVGWCNKEDVLVKAWRANKLGMRLMIDFHYSDTWADPGKQYKPAAWESLSFEDLKTAVSNHTTEVLTLLKDNAITPEWVQIGNETGNGMLWDDGKASESMAQYTALNNAGYDAAKAVFPDTKVIIHLQEGNKNSKYRWLFDGLKDNGGKWDVIGMSLYPTSLNWDSLLADMISNMNDMISRYGTEVMVCETGMPWNEEEAAYKYLSNLISQCKTVEGGKCLGVLYWEPQTHNGWKGYMNGAFDDSGKPTAALNAFSE